MKLAVSGKGGVGKTTVCALLAKALKAAGRDVVAIDCDPDSNLAACLGYEHPEKLMPLVALKDLIEEKMGVKPGTTGGMFRLNPFVDDIPDRYAIDIDGIRVLVAGAVKKGGAGCYCPENALVRALIAHMLLDGKTDLILDMEAGVEHLSRGTVRTVDSLLVVSDPSLRAVETALRIRELAGQLGLRRVLAVGNKIRSDKDARFLAEALPGWEFAGLLPYDDSLRDAEMSGRSVADGAGRETLAAVARITDWLAARPADGQSS